MLDAEARGCAERREHRVGWCLANGRKKRLGPQVGAAAQVKPKRHLPVAERVRQPFAEAHLALCDRQIAAAAFGAAARRGLDHVCHGTIIEGGLLC